MFSWAGKWGSKERLVMAVEILFAAIIFAGFIACALEANSLGLGIWQYFSSTLLAGLEKRFWGRKFFGRSITGLTLVAFVLNLLR